MKTLFTLFALVFYLNGWTQIINTIAGNGIGNYSGDGGFATSAELYHASAVALDVSGNIFIADVGNNVIRKINTTGIISTVAGNGTQGYSGDGGPATLAQLNTPGGIVCDTLGNLFITEYNNNCIRMVNTMGIISTIAGNGIAGYSGDNGPATAAEINVPVAITIDHFGNLYVADRSNNRIRKINTAGIISTVAGIGTNGYNGDGGSATAAELYLPCGVALDALGNLYIADQYNHRVRQVNTSGIISTIAGNGSAGFSGDGSSASLAQLNYPGDVVVDALGNLYITDQVNNRVRVVNYAGIMSTIAGNGNHGYSGDGGPAIAAELYYPLGISLDSSGNLYIADQQNNRIRMMPTRAQTTTINQLASHNEQVMIYPNPSNGMIQLIVNNIQVKGVNIYDVTGKLLFKKEELKSQNGNLQIDLSNLENGIYNLSVINDEEVVNKHIIIVK